MSAPGEWWMRWRVRLGYPVALLTLWLAQPTSATLAVGAIWATVGLIIRAKAAGHLRKHEQLATTGPYARTRNPLYYGSAFVAFGFLVAANSWVAAIVGAVYFGIFYRAVMKREAEELRARYGTAYEEYAARVPLFLPRMPAWAEMLARRYEEFSWEQYRRNREYQAALGAVLALGILAAKMWFQS